MHVTLDEPDNQYGQDDVGLCPLLDDLWLGVPPEGLSNDPEIGTSRITAYHFTMDPTWNDGKCVGGDPTSSCLVRVRITAYFDEWCKGRKCGRLVLFRGWGDANPGEETGLAEGELNPFVVQQTLKIHFLEVRFMGIGKNTEVAACEYGGTDENDRFWDTGITWEVNPLQQP